MKFFSHQCSSNRSSRTMLPRLSAQLLAVGTPVNGMVEVAGPARFRLDELMRLYLDALDDPRKVVTDPNALYYGIHVGERTLVPEANAKLGEMRFEDWLPQGTLKK